EGIGLRGYGQKDPLIEYKRESFDLFQAMKDRVDEDIVHHLWWLRPVLNEERQAPIQRAPPPRSPPVLNNPGQQRSQTSPFVPKRAAAPAAPVGRNDRQPARVGGDDAEIKTVRRDEPKVGRNEPCPCGSGKKYKKCHGAAA